MKLLKRAIVFALACAVVFAFAACGGESEREGESDAGILNVYMWSDYMYPEVAAKFEEETGVKINFQYIASTEEAVAKLKTDAGSQYDLVMPSDADMITLIEGGFLHEIDASKLPNLKNLGEEFKGKDWNEGNKWAVPYFMNYVYVVYDDDMCPVDITKYDDFLKEEMNGKYATVSGLRNLMAAGLAAQGLDPNSKEEADIKKSAEWLEPYLKNAVNINSDNVENNLIDGSASAALIFDGQAARAFIEAPDHKWKVAEMTDPIQLGVDEWVIPKGAKNVDNAHKFINFLLDAENMAININGDENGGNEYSCPNDEAVALVIDPSSEYYNENYASNIALQIPQIVKDNHFLQEDVGEALTIYDKYYTEVMTKIGQ